MTSLNCNSRISTLVGFCLAVASGAYGQISSINSAYLDPNSLFQPQIPGSTFTYNNSYPTSVTLTEANVANAGGGGNTYANKNVWYFSNDGGATPYQFQSGDYFNASFTFTLTGNDPNQKDLEGGLFFHNPSGSFGGDLAIYVVGGGGNAGVVFQGGGPSYYPFSPLAGGYPGAGGSVPNYSLGETYTLGLSYTIDPNTGKNAFEYSVNGQYAASAAGDPYFDLGAGQFVGGSGGDTLGGYLQVQTDPTNPNQGGQAVFGNTTITPVPEPSLLALAGLGVLPLVRQLRRRA
ncbi:MAG: hypothetical protein KGJ60_12715 [Verrucomicrobiota bacterium]|nr:hypothetical protein [Verrucomicrobiota bacterium]